MTPEQTFFIALFTAILASVGTPLLAKYLSRAKDSAELSNYKVKTEAEVAGLVSAMAGGSTASIKAFVESIEYWKKETAEIRLKNDELELQVDAIKVSRKITEEALEARIKAELIDSREIRAENAILTKQIIKLETTVVRMGRYVDTMNTAMKDAGIPVPQNGELLESVRRLQLSIEERERLKGAGK